MVTDVAEPRRTLTSHHVIPSVRPDMATAQLPYDRKPCKGEHSRLASQSGCVTGRQAQARQKKLAVFGRSQKDGVRYYDRRNGAQPADDLSCVVKSAHMRITRGEIAIRLREARILLNRQEQFRRGLFEAPAEEVSATEYSERRAGAGTGTKAQRGFDMFDRNIGLACPIPKSATYRPAARKARVECQGTVHQRHSWR